MAASAKKKNKKGKTISLTDFLAEEGGTGGGSTYVFKSVSWADETDDLEGGVSTVCTLLEKEKWKNGYRRNKRSCSVSWMSQN
uniref:Uncharacterized protein n=1 Tax=Colobus angolensis palliatus TaxID=336983 RepID=A0A2K5KDS6_COLAP